MAKHNPKSYGLVDLLHAVKSLLVAALVVLTISAGYGVASGIAHIARSAVTGLP